MRSTSPRRATSPVLGGRIPSTIPLRATTPQRPLFATVAEAEEPTPSSVLASLVPTLKLGPPPPSRTNSSKFVDRQSPFPSLLQRRADQGNAARKEAVAGRGPSIVWFRSDLRTHDHEGLAHAQKNHSSIVPLYIFDDREFGTSPSSPSSTSKAGSTRAKLIIESLAELRSKLRDLGSDLIVRRGRAEHILPELAKKVGANAVYAGYQTTLEEGKTLAAVRRSVEAAGASLKVVGGPTMLASADLPVEQTPATLKEFEAKATSVPVRDETETPRRLHGLPLGSGIEAGPIPSLRDLGLTSTDAYTASARGGEKEALRVLSDLMRSAKAGQLTAAQAGQPVTAGLIHVRFDELTKFLALGCLSARRVHHEIKRQLEKAGNEASRAVAETFHRQLRWRDWHHLVTLKAAGVATTAAKPQLQTA